MRVGASCGSIVGGAWRTGFAATFGLDGRERMSKRQMFIWYKALWHELNVLHEGPRRWVIWNDVEEFFMPWIRDVECFLEG